MDFVINFNFVRDALADMLKTLILSFQDKSNIKFIYVLILNYIDNALKEKHTETTVFNLWYFMAQHYYKDSQLDELYLVLFVYSI